MAVTAPEATTSSRQEVGCVMRIPRIRIRRFQNQPRTYFDAKDMSDLAASIEEIGQQTPIVVKAITNDPKHDYELVDGERRWIACGMAGIETMLAWVRTVADSDEHFTASVVGNFGRSEHTALEIAQAIDRIRKSKRMEGLSPGEQIARIAKIFAHSGAWVYQHLAILRLHPDVQAMMVPTLPEEERLSHSLGIFISSLHEDLQKKIAQEAVRKNMNINQARIYARQVAEEAGERVGINKRRSPAKDYRNCKAFIQRTQETVEAFSTPSMQEVLRKRNPEDLAVMAMDLRQCGDQLIKLGEALLGKPPRM